MRTESVAKTHVPRDSIEGGPKVEEEHGSLAAGRESGSRVPRRVLNIVVSSDGEHGKSAADRADQKLQIRIDVS